MQILAIFKRMKIWQKYENKNQTKQTNQINANQYKLDKGYKEKDQKVNAWKTVS